MNIEEIWEKFNRNLFFYIKSRVRSLEDAHDIHAEVFLKILQVKTDLTQVQNLHGWIYRIAKNKIIDHYRARKSSEELTDNLADNSEIDPLDRFADEQLRACLEKLISMLPSNYKEALISTQLLEIPDKEYAKAANFSLAKTKSLIRRAKLKLLSAAKRCLDNSLSFKCLEADTCSC
jgi:RNA polymerase sigma-70 factor (ECF subfamily)